MKKVDNIFESEKIHHLPVVDEGKLIGMLSKSDLLFCKRNINPDSPDLMIEDLRLNSIRAEEIMTTGLAQMEPEDRIEIALEVFKINMFHAIPIVKDGHLVGIVTTLDIIRHLANDQEAVRKYQ